MRNYNPHHSRSHTLRLPIGGLLRRPTTPTFAARRKTAAQTAHLLRSPLW